MAPKAKDTTTVEVDYASGKVLTNQELMPEAGKVRLCSLYIIKFIRISVFLTRVLYFGTTGSS